MYYRVRLLFDAALQSYEKQTGIKLIDHPFARQLENCPSIDSVVDILQQQSRALIEFCGDDGKVIKSLKRTAHVLNALSTSTTLGEDLVRQLAFVVVPFLDSRSIANPP
jgi:hypothetical protein